MIIDKTKVSTIASKIIPTLKANKNVVVAVVITAFIIIGVNHCTKPKPIIPPISNELTIYKSKVDSLNNRLKIYEDSIITLINLKSKIKIKYETVIQAYTDPTVISDDSVARYIQFRIQSKRESFSNIQ